MKRKQQNNLSLFEAPISTTETNATDSQQRSESLKIKNPCPRCGGRSAVSKRQVEGSGMRYCLGGCLSEDRTDCFYFNPVKKEGEPPF